MTLSTAAWGYDAKTFNGEDMRWLIGSVFPHGGAIEADDFVVAAQGTPGPTVQVSAGAAVVAASGAGLFGAFHVWNDASINSASFAATGADGRKDFLILRVTAGVPALEIVQGTASGSPAEPSISGDNYLVLALITLPPATANVTNSMITDRRQRARQYSTALSTAVPAAPSDGDLTYDTDTKIIKVWNGSAEREVYRDGAWASWTPTISGSGVVQGNATVSGHYLREGQKITAKAHIVFGNATNFGAGIAIGNLPVASAATYLTNGRAWAAHIGGNFYSGSWAVAAGGTSGQVWFNEVFAAPGAAFLVLATASFPFTWAAGDTLDVELVYEAAS